MGSLPWGSLKSSWKNTTGTGKTLEKKTEAKCHGKIFRCNRSREMSVWAGIRKIIMKGAATKRLVEKDRWRSEDRDAGPKWVWEWSPRVFLTYFRICFPWRNTKVSWNLSNYLSFSKNSYQFLVSHTFGNQLLISKKQWLISILFAGTNKNTYVPQKH